MIRKCNVLCISIDIALLYSTFIFFCCFFGFCLYNSNSLATFKYWRHPMYSNNNCKLQKFSIVIMGLFNAMIYC